MKILSEDGYSQLTIEQNDSQDPNSTYTIFVKLAYGGSVFCGHNDGVHFSGKDRFVAEFERFLAERKDDVILEMTEGCQLVFYRRNLKGDVGMKCRVCKYAYTRDPIRTVELVAEGEMTLDSQKLNQLFKDIETL